VALAKPLCANGVLFESILRAVDLQKGFHTAKTHSCLRIAFATPWDRRTLRIGWAIAMERRLDAVLTADVVGYSQLMERDKEGALELLRAPSQGAVRAGDRKVPWLHFKAAL
jgi:hypothetical protein